MSTIQAARTLLRQTESSLRQLLEAALTDKRYADVAEIAMLVDGLSRILEPTHDEMSALSKSPSMPTGSPLPPRKAKSLQKASAKRSAYPKFKRDGDRLVKVGWSKKNKSEYEHRVPRSAVDALLGKLASTIKPGQVFDVERILPVTDQAGDDVPAYQVYVTFAWLRDIAVIAKKGRDGYVVDDFDAIKNGADESWQVLPDLR